MRKLFLFVLLFIISIAAYAQNNDDEQPVLSPAVNSLTRQLTADKSKATADFWNIVQTKGAPLIEPVPDAPGYSILTFVFRGESNLRSVRLDSSINALLIKNIEPDFEKLGYLKHITGTDIWYLSFRAKNDLRTSYNFIPEYTDGSAKAKSQIDPLNPNVFAGGVEGQEVSIAELPGARPQIWSKKKADAAAPLTGNWENFKFAAKALGSERTIYVYKPAGYDQKNSKPYNFVVCFGGFEFGVLVPTRTIIDNLMAAGKIPPTVVILIDNLDGKSAQDDYTATTQFVADELVPDLRKKYNLTKAPSKTAIAGTSQRGLVAGLLGFRRPDVFGNVLSMSGSFYWKPVAEGAQYEWLASQMAADSNKPLKLYFTAGLLETVVTPKNAGHYMLSTNRHLKDVLQAKGYKFKYEEFNGGHEDLNWQDAFAGGLIYLFGSSKN